MDVKAFRKAEDSLAKAIAQHEAAPVDSKKRDNAAGKVVEAALQWAEARQADE